jgi:hypothetical protein
MGLEDRINTRLGSGRPHSIDVLITAKIIQNPEKYNSRLKLNWEYVKMKMSYVLGIYGTGGSGINM